MQQTSNKPLFAISDDAVCLSLLKISQVVHFKRIISDTFLGQVYVARTPNRAVLGHPSPFREFFILLSTSAGCFGTRCVHHDSLDHLHCAEIASGSAPTSSSFRDFYLFHLSPIPTHMPTYVPASLVTPAVGWVCVQGCGDYGSIQYRIANSPQALLVLHNGAPRSMEQSQSHDVRQG